MKRQSMLAMILMMFIPLSLLAADIKAVTTRIIDGDTIEVNSSDRGQFIVRLLYVDAPEANQPFGEKAERFTSDAVLKATVIIKTKGADRYGRILGQVIYPECNGRECVDKDLSIELLRAGLAHWEYRYDKSKQRMEHAKIEAEAKINRKGLWSQSCPIPPACWRGGARLRR